MQTPGVGFLLVFGIGLAAIYIRGGWHAWRRWRGVRLVTCPETSRAAAVTIDTRHAAATAIFENAPELRLATCSRWAARAACRQPCLLDLARAGDAAKVDTLAARWYSGRTCVLCGKRIERPTSRARPPAVLGRDGVTMEWPSIPADQLLDAFAARAAVCWDCHLTQSFRHLYPDLYIDRTGPTSRRQ